MGISREAETSQTRHDRKTSRATVARTVLNRWLAVSEIVL